MKRLLTPSFVVALVLLLYLGVVFARAGGDPLAFARIGAGLHNGVPVDENQQGYDGQFAYYLALDPRPEIVAQYLDVPAYRYQRILYPLLARLLALGQAALIPWVLVLINFAAQITGTFLLERWLLALRLSRWYALIYGLWVGLATAVRLDLNEPLCYALIVGAMLAVFYNRHWLAALLLALAVLTKENALPFVAAAFLSACFAQPPHLVALSPCQPSAAPEPYTLRLGPWALRLVPYALSLVPFALLQLFIYSNFGAWELASGGYMATPFEIIPYLGFWKIGMSNAFALGLLFVFGLLVVLPSVWGIVTALRKLWARDFSPAVWVLALNAGFIPFTPFSTFREAGGILRLATGLVLAVLLYCAQARDKRTLNYVLCWLAGLAFLFKE